MLVYRTPLFDKQLKALGKAEKKGSLAAERAGQIIKYLSAHDRQALAMKNKLTKRGELRVRNCRKYDLGSGYRLITMIMENKLFLFCVGTHDECDRWLNNKRGKSLQLEPENFVFVAENGEVEPQQLLDDSWPEEESDEYEEHLLARLSDADLRYIFSGICQG